MAINTEIRKITRSDYYKMAELGILTSDEKVELLNGIIYLKNPNNLENFDKMSPIKSRHAGVVTWFSTAFAEALRGKAFFSSQNPIILNNNSEPEPDFMVLEKIDGYYRNEHPKPENVYLLVEVSDTTLKRDKTKKLQAYAQSNIEEYWIINLVDDCVEVFKQPKNGKYKSYQVFENKDVVRFERFEISFAVKEILG
jgi:Uma2 family endonuclease